MNRMRIIASAAALCLLVTVFVPVAFAGTQDFTLVNRTGGEIYSLYLSETYNEDWEEDVLGDDVLPDGSRINVTFAGRRACTWDILVTDRYDNSVTWNGINLCETSVVVLRCNDEECWAETE